MSAELDALLERIELVLLHQVGDARMCPHCRKAYQPRDVTQEIAKSVYDDLKAYRSNNAA